VPGHGRGVAGHVRPVHRARRGIRQPWLLVAAALFSLVNSVCVCSGSSYLNTSPPDSACNPRVIFSKNVSLPSPPRYGSPHTRLNPTLYRVITSPRLYPGRSLLLPLPAYIMCFHATDAVFLSCIYRHHPLTNA